MDTIYERRKFIRRVFNEPVQIRPLRGGQSYGAVGYDIGGGGLSVSYSRFLPKETKVEVEGELKKPDQRFLAVAKVTWSQKISYVEDQYRLGLQFVELPHESTQRIRDYLKKVVAIVSTCLLVGGLSTEPSFGYWEWTPQTGRWINPKYAAKSTPREQYEWAVSFYQAKDYKKSIREFKKLVKYYPNSEYAPKAQLGLGESYEQMGEYYQAFQAYQRLIDTYPSYSAVENVIERQYRIGNLFFEGQKRKVFGVAILPSGEQAIEIFKKVVDNAPYGPYGEIAQYKIGECYKKLKKYSQARDVFETLIRQYPQGEYVESARFQIALSTIKESKRAQYDQQSTDQAIEEFRKFVYIHPGHESSGEAKEMIRELEDRKAEKSYQIAKFYESQKNLESAKIYYQEILTQYPESSYASTAKEKLEKILHGT